MDERVGYTIDENGFYVTDVMASSGIVPDVTAFCPDGFYRPKWDGSTWIEGLTQEEIDDIRNAPVPKSEVELLREENEQLNLSIIEIWESIIPLLPE